MQEGFAKGCTDWLLNRSVWHLYLILEAGMMAKGSLMPGIQAEKREGGGGLGYRKVKGLESRLLTLLARPHPSPRGRCWGNGLWKVKWEV